MQYGQAADLGREGRPTVIPMANPLPAAATVVSQFQQPFASGATGPNSIMPQPGPTLAVVAPAEAARGVPQVADQGNEFDGALATEANPWTTLQGQVQQYRRTQGNRLDPLRGSLGMLNAGLIEIAAMLQGVIASSLIRSAQSAKQVSKILPLVDAQLRIVKQVERLSVLERTLPKSPSYLDG